MSLPINSTGAPWALVVLFVVAGVMHFVAPGAYMKIMPAWLPAHRTLVLVSGAFEILGALGLVPTTTRVAAGWGLIALLVAVFPANVQMLLDARARGGSTTYVALLWLRLPLQAFLIWWVYRAAVAPARPGG